MSLVTGADKACLHKISSCLYYYLTTIENLFVDSRWNMTANNDP